MSLSTRAAPATAVGAGRAWQGRVTAFLHMPARTVVLCALGSSLGWMSCKMGRAQQAAGEPFVEPYVYTADSELSVYTAYV
jgi:hypothetical protein